MIKKIFKTSFSLLLIVIIAVNSFCVGINDVNQYVTKDEYNKRVNSLTAKVNDMADKKDEDIEDQVKKYFVKNISSPVMAGGIGRIDKVGTGDATQWQISSGIIVWDGIINTLEDLQNRIYKQLDLSDTNRMFYNDENEAKPQYFYVRATLGAPYILNQDEDKLDASPTHKTDEFLLSIHFLNFEQFYIDASQIDMPFQWTIAYNASKKGLMNLRYTTSQLAYLGNPAKYYGWTGWHQNDNGIVQLTKSKGFPEFETVDELATYIEKLNPTHVPGRQSYIFDLKENGTIRQAAPADPGQYIVEVVYLTPYAGNTTVVKDVNLFSMTAIPLKVADGGSLTGNEMFYSYYNGSSPSHWATMSRSMMRRVLYVSSPNTSIGERNVSEIKNMFYTQFDEASPSNNWVDKIEVTRAEVTSLPLYQQYLPTSKTVDYLNGTITTSSFYLNMWYITFTIKTSATYPFKRNAGNMFVDLELFDMPFTDVLGRVIPLKGETITYTGNGSTVFDYLAAKIDENGKMVFTPLGYGNDTGNYTLALNTEYKKISLHLMYLSSSGHWYNEVAGENSMLTYHKQVGYN